MKPVPVGARGEAEEVVEFEQTLAAHHPQLPPVYSTPDMIRLMETAALGRISGPRQSWSRLMRRSPFRQA